MHAQTSRIQMKVCIFNKLKCKFDYSKPGTVSLIMKIRISLCIHKQATLLRSQYKANFVCVPNKAIKKKFQI